MQQYSVLVRWSLVSRAVMVLVIICAFGSLSSAQTVSTIANFLGPDGQQPISPLVQARNGNLVGTTWYGGGHKNGSIFEITPSGDFRELYAFCAQSGCPDGASPNALVLGTDGNFYGTTNFGGSNSGGTVFKFTPQGKLVTLYSFCSAANCADGQRPIAGLVEGLNGNFYGTTWFGGANDTCAGTTCGTIFEVTPDGKFTSLYSFCSQLNCADGAQPAARLLLASDGNFYGTTQEGGTNGFNYGTIFKITSHGALTTLYSFCSQPGCGDGELPSTPLVQGTDGNLYSTTFEGGTYQANGSVFVLTPDDQLATLFSFCCANGYQPISGLTEGTNGEFYGTTFGGSSIYEITAAGDITTLNTSLDDPQGGVVQSTNGLFYGTTEQGGSGNCFNLYHQNVGCGTVYTLDMGLGPFVTFVLPAGRVSQVSEILGQHFTGTTSVILNGTPMRFTVVSDTFLEATVPTGATTGYVSVTTPSGMLTSNVPFHVIP